MQAPTSPSPKADCAIIHIQRKNVRTDCEVENLISPAVDEHYNIVDLAEVILLAAARRQPRRSQRHCISATSTFDRVSAGLRTTTQR